jgi:hypothetical protein
LFGGGGASKVSTMKRKDDNHTTPSHDYGLALQSAVSWLGDRYLLATPQARRPTDAPKYWTSWQHAAAHVARRATRH